MVADADEVTVRTVIAALPGWYAALYLENSRKFALEPIVAWEIARTEYRTVRSKHHDAEDGHYIVVTPLTLEGDLEDSGNISCVKTPDGVFDFVGERVFDEEAGALAYAAELAVRATAARLKRAAGK